MYKLTKKILFLLDPEVTHNLTFKMLKFLNKIPFYSIIIRNNFIVKDKKLEKKVFGIKFKNSVGLGAGLDKNAICIDELYNMGFGSIEIGTVTPKPQNGNPKKRLFRLKKDKALINRMGFNNLGVDKIVENLKKVKSDAIIGGNIGKNKITSNENAINDYLICFEKLFNYVHYFVVNVSSPNTPNLRELQDKEPLKNLLNSLQKENNLKKERKPILLKIAPDLTNDQLDDIIEVVNETKIDGIIATNTTLSRENLKEKSNKKDEIGGLSGLPLREKSTQVIKYLSTKSNKSFPIIGIGGINSTKDALEKLDAGASLIQLYTGFIYQGPKLIRNINKTLLN